MLTAAALTTTLSSLSWPILGVAGTGFVLGCRHGLDWDHIAAITDLTTASSSEQDQRHSPALHGHRRRAKHPRSLGLAVWYCIGHGMVIALLGAAVGILGLGLPPGLDQG